MSIAEETGRLDGGMAVTRATDFFQGEILPWDEAVREYHKLTGEQVSVRTLREWSTEGKYGVRLPSVRGRYKTFTSMAAIRWFMLAAREAELTQIDRRINRTMQPGASAKPSERNLAQSKTKAEQARQRALKSI